ncbi:hypothetical protein, partial [Escherichia coli]
MADNVTGHHFGQAGRIDAESYILIDYNSGKVLAEQNADVR